MKKAFIFLLVSFLFFNANAQYNKVVAKDGTGDYTTVQASIDAAPTNSATAYVIFIKNGKYYEKINIPSNKPNIQLIGESVANVMVYYDDYAGKPIAGGGTLGTQNSASVTINANDFVAVNITFANTFNYDSASAAGVAGTQAVAVTINADRSAFKNCRFIGMQDTLYTKGGGTPRHYFYKCYIDGIVDFIFGSSIAIFDSCVVYPKARTGTGTSYITAANTPIGQTYGYLFRDCKIPANTGATLYYLGRPWGNSNSTVTSNSKTVFFNTAMSNSVNTLGWSVWDATTNTSVITYGEFESKKLDGTLLNVGNRVAWSKQFTTTDTIGYNIPNMFSGWIPCSVRTDFCSGQPTEIAVSNFKGIKSGANANFTWNASWALTGVNYELYKSIDNKATFNVLSNTIATNDTAINFNGVDALPPAGSSYYYFVKASLAGSNTYYTDTIAVSSIPTINTTVSSLTNFLQGSTAPSGNQTYIVSGVNLLNNITITAPTNYEVSKDGTTWANSTSSITLVQTAGSVANTVVYVRLNATSAGSYSGNITHQTVGVATTHTVNIAVSGVTQNTPLQIYNTIQQWNLTANNLDDATVRATGLLATTPTFKRLNLSNGTEVAAVTAYSTLYGQAFAPSSTGNGMWTTASGGSGSTLSRTLYEQFTIKPDVNYNVRIDSFAALIGYYASVSGTKIAVAYSTSNFTTDSANVTGGRDVSGTLPNTANGAFATPIVVIATSNTGNTSPFSFALNAGNGVQLNAGDSLTVRVYFSCGSTSAGRYAVIKNVQIKGTSTQTLPLKIVTYELKIYNKKQVENFWQTTNEINVSHFNIQRSIDGNDFVNIGNVKAQNNHINTYKFTDDKLSATNDKLTIYYRIESIDKDGKKQYSEIKKIHLNEVTNTPINIYPNPAKDVINVNVENIKSIAIINAKGSVVYSKNVEVNNSKIVTVNCKQFAKGWYVINVVLNDGNIKTEKLLIE